MVFVFRQMFDQTILHAARLPTIFQNYGRDETVYRPGAPARFIYVVSKGAFCRFRLFPDGRRLITQFLLPGDGFGYELGRQQHDDTVQALAVTNQVAFASKDALLKAAKSDAHLANLLFTAAARAAAIERERFRVLLNRTTTEQVALFLLEMDTRLSRRGEIDLPMRRSCIADYLGRRIESVSRVLSAFRRAKIIEFLDHPKIQRRVAIRDKRRLERFAWDASDFGWGKS